MCLLKVNYKLHPFIGKPCYYRESGILELVRHLDLILADRGFPLEECLAARGARYKVPAFMKDRDQLPADEAEITKRIANVRIHVERVIGATRARFKILKGPISIKFISAIDDMHSFVDKIVKVCCVLNNFLPSVVPLDLMKYIRLKLGKS